MKSSIWRKLTCSGRQSLLQHQGGWLPDNLGAVPDRLLRPDFPKSFVGVRQHLLHLRVGVLIEGAKHLAIECFCCSGSNMLMQTIGVCLGSYLVTPPKSSFGWHLSQTA